MVKQVFWSLADRSEIEKENPFLSEAEQAIFDRFRFELRRNSYLAGRWVAKDLIKKALSLDNAFCEISILNESSGKPYAIIGDIPLDGELSISHGGCWAVAALSVDGLRVGVDVEVVTPRPKSFVGDYFTSDEIEILECRLENYDRAVTLIWSAKEAMLKALGLGLRLDTRRVWVDSYNNPKEGNPEGWNRLTLGTIDDTWSGYWRQIEGAVLVFVTDSQRDSEVELIRV